MSPEERFHAECPHVDVGYVQREAPRLVKLAERYNHARAYAANHADIDACIKLKDNLIRKVAAKA